MKERIIQGVMRINLNEVLNSEIPRLPNEETEEEKISKAMAILKETNQSEYKEKFD